MFVCHDGEFFPVDQKLFDATNRSFKWGDGLFETMKIMDGTILLEHLHFDRFFQGLHMLGIKSGSGSEEVQEKILKLCKKNHCLGAARVRLSAYRKEDHSAGYVIEGVPISAELNSWNSRGWTLGIYPYSRKSTDALSNLKSANYLPYVLAAIHAKQNQLDEALVLNTENKIADASKANIFLIKKAEVFTPALNQGCVQGVMRRHLIEQFKILGLPVRQEEISEQDLNEAEEIFLTNALYGMRWVQQFNQTTYGCSQSIELYRKTFPG
ncbi:MAG: aminotransferase class IV [Flavisolibacter sp.]